MSKIVIFHIHKNNGGASNQTNKVQDLSRKVVSQFETLATSYVIEVGM